MRLVPTALGLIILAAPALAQTAAPLPPPVRARRCRARRAERRRARRPPGLGERAGAAIDRAAEQTGQALGRAADESGSAVGRAMRWTGERLQVPANGPHGRGTPDGPSTPPAAAQPVPPRAAARP